MGQKTSPLSVRENIRYNVWGGSVFVEDYVLREYILYYFTKKGLLVNELTIKKEGNTLYVELEFVVSRSSTIYTRRYRRFFKRKKVKQLFKRKIRISTNKFKRFKRFVSTKFLDLKQKNFFKSLRVSSYIEYIKKYSPKLQFNVKKTLEQKKLSEFLKLLCKLYNVGRVHFIAKRLEKGLNGKLIKKISKNAKSLGLFRSIKEKNVQDLVILSTLLMEHGDIRAATLNRVITKYFTWLPKRQHKDFFVFIRDFFKLIYNMDKNHKNLLHGLKFVVSGRLLGKTRASKNSSIVGRIFTQTLSVNVDFSKLTSYSRLGTFGWKIWIAKKAI